MTDGRFDELLLGMAQKHKGIEDLLYTIMSFYERRTDFFHVQEEGSSKGRAAGKAEESFKQQFRAMQKRYLERAQPHLIATPEQIAAATCAGGATSSRGGGYSGSAPAVAPATAGGADAAGGGAPAPAPAAAPAASPKQQAPIPDGVGASPLEGGDPGQWAKMQAGASGYKWNQSVQDVTVEIDVEKCTAADIKVSFTPKKLTVKRKGEVILEGVLAEKINCEESTWHLDSGKQVVLSLEKVKPTFWEGFFESR